MSRFIIVLIKGYQKYIRPFFPAACRFTPSCSQYTIESIQKYRLGKGLFKAFSRIARCSPFSLGGYDPVK